MNRAHVAQILNLLYRRFAIGSASANPNAPNPTDAVQDAILRYGRLQICATPSFLWFMVPMRAKFGVGACHEPVSRSAAFQAAAAPVRPALTGFAEASLPLVRAPIQCRFIALLHVLRRKEALAERARFQSKAATALRCVAAVQNLAAFLMVQK